MPESDDSELLAQYARDQSEEAFAALVTRHINMVYSVALRQVSDSHQAEDVTQVVFLLLAKKAGSLSPQTILSGWLYRTAQLTATNYLRIERRRQRREQEAHMQSVMNESEPEIWAQIAPALDIAMAHLGNRERNAVILRFFEGKSLKEVGNAVGAIEDAAQKSIERALKKLRQFFTKRGITLSAAALAGVLATHSVQAAPTGLADSIITAGITKGAAVSGPSLILMKSTLKLMTWFKIKTAVAATISTILIASTVTVAIAKIEKNRASSIPPTPTAIVAASPPSPSSPLIQRIQTSVLDKQDNHNYDVATYLRQHGAQEPPGVVLTGTLPLTGDASTDPATLETAAHAGDLGKIKAVLKADPNSLFDTQGGQYAPLVAAARAGHKDIVEFLLANHADINGKDYDMTALGTAAQDGNMEMAKLLLANKADPNIGDERGLTPLYYAALMDRKDMLELLLAHGANVNAPGKQGSGSVGETPLYIAACNGLADVAKVLLAHGADPGIKGPDGLTPLEIAVKNHHDTADVPENDVADLLRPPAPPAPQPPVNPVVALPPGVTAEMEQTFLARYKAALEKPDPDAYMALVANDPKMDSKAREDMKGLELFGGVMTLSNPNRTYTFVPLTPDPQDKPTELAGKMYGDYLPPVIALKITFGKPAHSSPDAPVAVGDATLPLCLEDHQLMLCGFKEIPGAVPPPAVDKTANFGIEPNLRQLSDKAQSEGEDGFTSLPEFLGSLKQPSVEILDSGENKFEYFAICRIAPNLCVWAGGDKVGEGNYTFYFRATDANKQQLKGSQKWIRLVDVPADNGQAPNVQGTVFFVPDHYTGPITIDPHYSDDAGNKIPSVARTVDWK